jgi:hypothetical protein
VTRTDVAVTAPLLAVLPKALTQSPTATAADVAVFVWVNVVEFDSVTLRLCVLGVAGFLLLAEVLDGRVN